MGNSCVRENFTHMREAHAQFAPSIRLKAQLAPRKGQFAQFAPVAQNTLFGGCSLVVRRAAAESAPYRPREGNDSPDRRGKGATAIAPAGQPVARSNQVKPCGGGTLNDSRATLG